MSSPFQSSLPTRLFLGVCQPKGPYLGASGFVHFLLYLLARPFFRQTGGRGRPALIVVLTEQCAMAMANLTISDLPPLPQYTLTSLPSLVPHIPDKLLTLLLPIAAYWGLSMLFHWIDSRDYFPQYRLHTPAEVLKRNHVSRWEVFRDVVIQQVVQTAVGWVLGLTEPEDVIGKDDFNVAVWARRIRIAQKALPGLLSLFGLNAIDLANSIAVKYPEVAGALSGGRYMSLLDATLMANGKLLITQGFASWEMLMAKAIYWFIVPALQFGLAILVLDTWQYFLHRAMHMNKWLYSMCFAHYPKFSV